MPGFDEIDYSRPGESARTLSKRSKVAFSADTFSDRSQSLQLRTSALRANGDGSGTMKSYRLPPG